MTPRIKICGITRPEDAISAANLGADAVGLVFYSKSSRAVSIDQASEIITNLPPFITVVGLFVDADPNYIQDVLDNVPLHLLQFHGNEVASDCEQFLLPYIKAIHIKERMQSNDISAIINNYSSAIGVLLDTIVAGSVGGTGISFDWTIVPSIEKPVILAGGLQPTNIVQAISQVRPYAVDVSSGVESQPGIKDSAKIAAFIQGVRSVNIN